MQNEVYISRIRCCCTAVHLRCPTARPSLLLPSIFVEGQGPFQSFAEQARRSSLEQQALQGPSARESGLTQSGCMTADIMVELRGRGVEQQVSVEVNSSIGNEGRCLS